MKPLSPKRQINPPIFDQIGKSYNDVKNVNTNIVIDIPNNIDNIDNVERFEPIFKIETDLFEKFEPMFETKSDTSETSKIINDVVNDVIGNLVTETIQITGTIADDLDLLRNSKIVQNSKIVNNKNFK